MNRATQNILIIDNDEGMVNAISTRLEHNGYNCILASNGVEGLSEFSNSRVDLVVTDLNMPLMDGIALIQKIRTFSNIPVVILTGFVKEYTPKIAQMHNVSVMGKPFNTNGLLEVIETELATRSYRQAG